MLSRVRTLAAFVTEIASSRISGSKFMFLISKHKGIIKNTIQNKQHYALQGLVRTIVLKIRPTFNNSLSVVKPAGKASSHLRFCCKVFCNLEIIMLWEIKALWARRAKGIRVNICQTSSIRLNGFNSQYYKNDSILTLLGFKMGNLFTLIMTL